MDTTTSCARITRRRSTRPDSRSSPSTAPTPLPSPARRTAWRRTAPRCPGDQPLAGARHRRGHRRRDGLRRGGGIRELRRRQDQLGRSGRSRVRLHDPAVGDRRIGRSRHRGDRGRRRRDAAPAQQERARRRVLERADEYDEGARPNAADRVLDARRRVRRRGLVPDFDPVDSDFDPDFDGDSDFDVPSYRPRNTIPRRTSPSRLIPVVTAPRRLAPPPVATTTTTAVPTTLAPTTTVVTTTTSPPTPRRPSRARPTTEPPAPAWAPAAQGASPSARRLRVWARGDGLVAASGDSLYRAHDRGLDAARRGPAGRARRSPPSPPSTSGAYWVGTDAGVFSIRRRRRCHRARCAH